jgi:hypothetical protein
VILNLTVTDGNGCSSSSAPADVPTVPLPPTPTISADVNGTGTTDQACPEQPLTLHANGATGAVSYQWYKDIDLLAGETNSTYQATGSATYYVTATDANGCTTPQSAGYVVQNPTPHSAFITADGTMICSGGSVRLSSNSATGIQWYKDGILIPTGNSQDYVATAAGTYTAILDALGCHSTVSNSITLPASANPAPNATITAPATVLTNSSSNAASVPDAGAGATYSWLAVAGSITSGGGTHSVTFGFVANGTHPLSVTVTTADGCTSYGSVNVNSVATMTATHFGVSAPATVTTGIPFGVVVTALDSTNSPVTDYSGTVHFTSSSAGTLPSDYTFAGATDNGSHSTSATLTTVGAQTLSAGDGTISGSTGMTVACVNPDATITAPSSATAGSTGNLATVANAGAGATYNWSITNGTITAGTGTNSVTFTAGAVGTLTLQVTVTNSASCADTKSANVNVVLPAVTVTSVSPTSGSINGHTAVTVNGTGFQSGAAVTFGGSAATSIVVVSATKITAVTAAHLAGTVNVTVTNPDTSAGTLTNGYTYAQLFDANGDHTIDPSDIFYLISYLFLHGPAPVGGTAAGDANGDGMIDPSDIFYLVNYLYLGGPKPYAVPVAHTMSLSVPMQGSISLGQPVLRGDRYVVPVIVTGHPAAMALRLRFDGAAAAVTIARATGLQPAFEIARQTGRELTYLVDYNGTMDGVVANIEVPTGTRLSNIEIDSDMTLLCDRDGSRKATVAGGTLTVSGTSIDGDKSRIEKPRSEQ